MARFRGFVANDEPGASMIGKTLSHYEILEQVSQGGMGIVYRALDLKLKREVAIKVLRDDLVANRERKERFVQEALSAAALDHPHVAIVHEIDEVDGVTFIAMELIRGPVLRKALDGGRLPVRRVIDLAIEMIEGLGRAHERGIVHRDFKPGNVMMTEDGHAKIIDFGLAKLVEPLGTLTEDETYSRPLSQSGRIMGTVAYMSPEQARGERVDGRSDIFSFGIVLHEMLSGKLPFDGPSAVEMLSAILKERPRALPPIDLGSDDAGELSRIVATCLAKDPAQRYQTARELASDLQGLRRRVDSGTLDKPRSTPPSTPRALRWGLATTALGVGLAAAMIWAVVSRSTDAVAVLAMSYDGPEENENLGLLLPLAVFNRLEVSTGLQLAPFAVSRSYAPDDAPIDVASELGVDWIVRGSVRVDGSQLLTSVELTGPGGTRAGWPREVRGGVEEVIAIADGVATSIAAALESKLSGGSPWARNGEAIETYLQGKLFLEGWDVDVNYEKAEAAFERALQIDGGFAAAYAGSARALWTRYRETGEIDLVHRALTQAMRSVSLDPSLPEGHVALGIIQLGRGRSAEAVRAFRSAQELAPENDAVYRSIADAYAELGHREEAELLYERAIDLRPRYWENVNALGAFYADIGGLEEAKAAFRQVIRLRSGSDIGYTNLAAVHLMAGELEEAEPLLEAAIRFNPSSHSAHNNLGFVYFAEGRFEQAAGAFRAAIGLGAEDPAYYGALGDTLRQLERPEEARIAYTHAVELWRERLDVDPTDEHTRAELSTGLAGLARCDDARSQAALADAESEGAPYVSYTLAKTYAICGDEESALRHLRVAIREGLLVDVRTNPDLMPLLRHPSVRPLLQ